MKSLIKKITVGLFLASMFTFASAPPAQAKMFGWGKGGDGHCHYNILWIHVNTDDSGFMCAGT